VGVTKTRKDDEIKIRREEDEFKKFRREEERRQRREKFEIRNTDLKCHPQMFRP
jgi:hypothetical protein